MRLARAILLRLLFGLVSLVFISFVTFLADEAAPGDAATILAGDKATPEVVASIRHQMGLDRPWPVRYAEFVRDIATFDFGQSYYGTKEPVADILARTLPVTARVAFFAIMLAAAVGVTLGTLAALAENRGMDRMVLTLSTLGVTVPNFVLAPLLVYVLSVRLDLLPQTWAVDRVAPDFYYLVLPVCILAARPMAMLTRVTRASMIETLRQEFIRLATAKGVPGTRLVLRHALPNAILPVITQLGTSFGFLLTGSFVIEQAFALPGIGKTGIDSILRGDTPVIQATTFVAGAMFVAINLLVDLVLPIFDPRIRESQV